MASENLSYYRCGGCGYIKAGEKGEEVLLECPKCKEPRGKLRLLSAEEVGELKAKGELPEPGA
jgi:rubrerythrin